MSQISQQSKPVSFVAQLQQTGKPQGGMMRQQQPQKVQQHSRSTTDVLNNLNKVMLDGAQTSRWLELASLAWSTRATHSERTECCAIPEITQTKPICVQNDAGAREENKRVAGGAPEKAGANPGESFQGLSLPCLPALVSLLTRVCSPELGAEIMMKGPFDEWAET